MAMENGRGARPSHFGYEPDSTNPVYVQQLQERLAHMEALYRNQSGSVLRSHEWAQPHSSHANQHPPASQSPERWATTQQPPLPQYQAFPHYPLHPMQSPMYYPPCQHVPYALPQWGNPQWRSFDPERGVASTTVVGDGATYDTELRNPHHVGPANKDSTAMENPLLNGVPNADKESDDYRAGDKSHDIIANGESPEEHEEVFDASAGESKSSDNTKAQAAADSATDKSEMVVDRGVDAVGETSLADSQDVGQDTTTSIDHSTSGKKDLEKNIKEEVAGRTGNKNTTTTQEKTSRIRTVTHKWNEEIEKWEDFEAEAIDKTPDTSNESTVFRSVMDVDNVKKVENEQVEVHSQALRQLLADTDECLKEEATDVTQSYFCMESPFAAFARSWDRYVSACSPQPGDTASTAEAREDLKALLEKLRSSKALGPYLRSRDTMMSTKKIKFEFLWTLFPHGARVFVRSIMDELQVFQVRSCSDPPYTNRRFRVSCTGLDWNGNNFDALTYDFYIKQYSGERPISSLEVIPPEMFGNELSRTQTMTKLIERGRKYLDLCTKGPSVQCEYQGAAVASAIGLHSLPAARSGERMLFPTDEPDPDYDPKELDIVTMHVTGKQSRVIIDNYTFMNSGRNDLRKELQSTPPLAKKIPYIEPHCPCSICKSSPVQSWTPESVSDKTLKGIGEAFVETEARLLFLPPRLFGYALKDRFWGQFLLDKLKAVDARIQNDLKVPFYEELQLNGEDKELLMAYVKYHESPRSHSGTENCESDDKAFDIIEGKGQGLVILLHGPSGVGKTLTAESIALATGRPLLTVSVADIGTDAHKSDQALNDIFLDAARWNAVLLMDEADVFVEERRKGELERNALVSVLLSRLEYYNGIIILTTNRVTSIDAAIQSRIHLAISYKDLSPQQCQEIYMNRLKRVPNDEVQDRRALQDALKESQLLKFNKANGRQIRNIVNGARALAKSKGEPLELKHLEQAANNTTKFITSMEMLVHNQRMRNEVGYQH